MTDAFEDMAAAAGLHPSDRPLRSWRITVDVPLDDARVSPAQRTDLFTRVADAVTAWEPAARDGWDAEVFGAPADECCPDVRERLTDVAVEAVARAARGRCPMTANRPETASAGSTHPGIPDTPRSPATRGREGQDGASR